MPAVVRAEPAEWLNPDVSPDGRYIAMDIRANGHRDIWVYDWARGSLTRLTTEPTNEEFPVWTPDSTGSSTGLRLVRRSGRIQPGLEARGRHGRRPGADARAGPAQAGLVASTRPLLAYVAATPGREDDDVMILPIAGDECTRLGAWATHGVREQRGPRAPARFSPDGRWLAYSSNETGPSRSTCSRSPGPARGSSSRVASVRRGPARAASWCSRNAPSTTGTRC